MSEQDELVEYHGQMISKAWVEKIKAAQEIETYNLNGQEVKRLRFGQEDFITDETVCGDCGCGINEFHVPTCDIEVCPACREQSLSCGCEHEIDLEDGKPQIEYFFRMVEGSFQTILVDLSVEPHSELPYSLIFEVAHLELGSEGLVSEDERNELTSIADTLDQIAHQNGGRYVGNITSDTHTRWYYYSDNIDEISNAVHQNEWGREMKVYGAEDPEWVTYYQDLAPSTTEYQTIANRAVIASIEEHDKDIFLERNVIHFFVVEQEKRQALLKELLQLGYAQYSEDDAESKDYFGVEKKHAIDHETIDRITDAMVLLAEKYQADYDGWEAQLLKDEQ